MFYLKRGSSFIPTSYTIGPWSMKFQHGGPAAALLRRIACEYSRPGEENKAKYFTPRATFMFHSPIPVYEIFGVKVEELHRGKSAEHLNVSLWKNGGTKPVASAFVVRVPVQQNLLSPILESLNSDDSDKNLNWSEVPCAPNSKDLRLLTSKWHHSELPETTPTYIDSSYWRFLYGGLFMEYLSERKSQRMKDAKTGSFMWGESRVPYLYQSDESYFSDITGNSDEFHLPNLPAEQRLSIDDYVYSLCDSGSGICSQILADGNWEFPNIDYNVILFRKPDEFHRDKNRNLTHAGGGPFIGMKSKIEINVDGTAMSNTGIYDAKGILGKSFQTLIVKKITQK